MAYLPVLCDNITFNIIIGFLSFSEFILAIFTAHMSRDMATHKLDYSFCRSAHSGGYVNFVDVV